MESNRTVSELKASFIRAQVRILSERLEPSEGWRAYAAESSEEDLSDKVVEDALHKLNLALKHHRRVVYSSQAIHHVAQQIASLYWASVNRDIRTRNSYEKGIERLVDLTARENIGKLPVSLEDPSGSEQDRSRYQRLRERLASLDSRRQQRQHRLGQLRHLQQLLGPFAEPQKNIQPNLVTRDGELGQELDKMRMLVARVGGRINQGKRKRDDHESKTKLYSLGSENKLETLLEMT